MAYTKRTTAAAATDDSMAMQVRRNGSESRSAVIDLIEPVAAGIIADDPTVAAAAAAAANDAVLSVLALARWVRREGNAWVRDVPGGPNATHYTIPDHTGAYIVRATPFPVPSATALELNW